MEEAADQDGQGVAHHLLARATPCLRVQFNNIRAAGAANIVVNGKPYHLKAVSPLCLRQSLEIVSNKPEQVECGEGDDEHDALLRCHFVAPQRVEKSQPRTQGNDGKAETE